MAKTEIILGSGGGKGTNGTFTPNTSGFTPVELGFVPKYVVLWFIYSSSTAMTLLYDVDAGTVTRWYQNAIDDVTSAFIPDFMYLDGTKLYYKAAAAGYATPVSYMAYK